MEFVAATEVKAVNWKRYNYVIRNSIKTARMLLNYFTVTLIMCV